MNLVKGRPVHALVVSGLRKVYEGSGRRVEALRDLTFTVEAGELVCLVGPSGCGKTTLLKCVGGLLAPTAGAAHACVRADPGGQARTGGVRPELSVRR